MSFTRRHFLLAAPLLAACSNTSSKSADLAEVVSTANDAFAPQLLSGFYQIEQHSWRWAMPKFSVALKPPRRATKSGGFLLLRCSLPDSVLQKLRETTITPTLDGIPLTAEKLSASGLQEVRWKVPADALRGKTGVTAEFVVAPTLPPSDADPRDLALIVHAIGII